MFLFFFYYVKAVVKKKNWILLLLGSPRSFKIVVITVKQQLEHLKKNCKVPFGCSNFATSEYVAVQLKSSLQNKLQNIYKAPKFCEDSFDCLNELLSIICLEFDASLFSLYFNIRCKT